VAELHTGFVGPLQSELMLHSTQTPVDKQTGVAALHSAFSLQERHVLVVGSQTACSAVLQSVLATQPTHAPEGAHTPEAHTAVAEQPRQVFVVASQMGLSPLLQSLSLSHSAQVPAARHTGFAESMAAHSAASLQPRHVYFVASFVVSQKPAPVALQSALMPHATHCPPTHAGVEGSRAMHPSFFPQPRHSLIVRSQMAASCVLHAVLSAQ
jgi:hypothetical protein